jgi:vanillate O-demethylase ferredoxin subunit
MLRERTFVEPAQQRNTAGLLSMIDVRIAKREDQAERIISLELVADGELPAFEAGAHVDVEIAAGLLRQYSIANDPNERHRYLLGVLRETNSRGGSERIHSQFRPGARVRIAPPRNNFRLQEDAAHSVLLAGGIGVTPLLSMAHRLQRLGRSFALHYCARSRSSAAFLSEIAASAFAEKVVLHFDDGPAAQAFDVNAIFRSKGKETHFYVCGPTGFMTYVTANAEGLGVSAGNMHLEHFSADPDITGDRFVVVAARSGLEVEIGPSQTIAEVLAAHNIPVLLSCQEGVCGTCLTPVLDGVPDHRDLYLNDAEKAAGNQMTICCSRAMTRRIVLDI